ncbi:hypothetical protein EYF80_040794 [Liparis tanakae]|uniref:Uncharacterized protein n=1 Tax=Liparis tanakae TaxID=230148 RepID=A0A4Z2G917_9TELE|nr:hypothetical protein EYF80_040794 [Liparis tanakae]
MEAVTDSQACLHPTPTRTVGLRIPVGAVCVCVRVRVSRARGEPGSGYLVRGSDFDSERSRGATWRGRCAAGRKWLLSTKWIQSVKELLQEENPERTLGEPSHWLRATDRKSERSEQTAAERLVFKVLSLRAKPSHWPVAFWVETLLPGVRGEEAGRREASFRNKGTL